MSRRLAAKDRQEGEKEIKVVRRHTEASLFNLLRHRLLAAGQITTVEGGSGLAELQSRQRIELSGENGGAGRRRLGGARRSWRREGCPHLHQPRLRAARRPDPRRARVAPHGASGTSLSARTTYRAWA
jgi:hypothetical protein